MSVEPVVAAKYSGSGPDGADPASWVAFDQDDPESMERLIADEGG